ncbi:D-alanyl-D-alanine carboxypeptidase family protein [uncultured Fusobacterium sp.]|mgnify:FL=1|jgi:D-alanyl-D-alanine carboxypeptidase (penicillin-binding protein 5/6)|uniref:D-alanyl-D-alanine carboxypeptidase family protein n=1 Tax=Fusobacterium sp. TaxID=68766 RepID=UPI0025DD755E|nr:D-alanyl-D-alanine carboxypeptidase family protein [uncultured Fusobacterium sp.]
MKRIIGVLFCIMLLSVTVLGAEANKEEKPPYKAILLGDDKGKIYYSENADMIHPLASVTKVMTIMVVFDEIEKGRVKLTDKVKISTKVASIGGSRIYMKRGDIFTLEDLIKATGIYSANNAAYAIAEYVSNGDIDSFIKKMNKKAKEIGAEGELEFHTPNGLPPHMTKKGMDIGTAKGIYKMSIAAEKYKKYMEIASMKNEEIGNGQDGKIKLRNRNHLLGKEGVYGIKTGNHSKAGYNITVVSNKDDAKIFTVVLGSPTYKIRDKSALEEIEKFHENYNYRKIADKNIALGKVSVFSGDRDYIEVYPDKEYKKILPKDSDIKISIKRNKMVIAPVSAGKVLGEYRITIDGSIVQSGKLITKEPVKLSLSLTKYFKNKKAE